MHVVRDREPGWGALACSWAPPPVISALQPCPCPNPTEREVEGISTT